MTPQHFHQVSDMPRLPNNKIDRSALRTLRNAPRPAPKAHTRSDVLDVIINTWAQVLDRDVTVDDNFFDIGGSSFKLMLVNNRLNEALDREIPLVQLFEYTTPRALAAMLDNGEQPEPPQAEATFSLEDLTSQTRDLPLRGSPRITTPLLPGADASPWWVSQEPSRGQPP